MAVRDQCSEPWITRSSLLDRPGQKEIPFIDYENNIKLYPDFQSWFRESGVSILAIWGKHDLIFIPPGAEA